MRGAAKTLINARPTAVNLRWALFRDVGLKNARFVRQTEGLAPGTKLLSETTNEAGQTVQRTVDETGSVVENTLDESGNLLDETPVGSITDLPFGPASFDVVATITVLLGLRVDTDLQRILAKRALDLAARQLSGSKCRI